VAGPSASAKGALFEWGVSNLVLFQSGGDLRLVRPEPDDQDVDRILTRLNGRKARFIQLKTRATERYKDVLELSFEPIADSNSRHDLYLLAGQLLQHSPWVGPRFALIPASKLPKATATNQVKIFLPLSPKSKTKWAPYVHDTSGLATILSQFLDDGPAYPFPPPGGPAELVTRLSNRAQGHLIETEVAAHLLWFGGGRLNLWGPLVDEFGEDLAVTDRNRAAALRIQPKGTVGLDKGNLIHVRVREATFRASSFDFLVFANYDPALGALSQHAFVLRADEFAAKAKSYEGYLHFIGRPDPKAKDKWRPWLYRVDEIAGVVETALRARRAWGEAAVLPATRVDVRAACRKLGLRRLPPPRPPAG
jgi:hypothetical protein